MDHRHATPCTGPAADHFTCPEPSGLALSLPTREGMQLQSSLCSSYSTYLLLHVGEISSPHHIGQGAHHSLPHLRPLGRVTTAMMPRCVQDTGAANSVSCDVRAYPDQWGPNWGILEDQRSERINGSQPLEQGIS